MSDYTHISVMLNEMLKYLAPLDNEIILDATFGAGGYTKSILNYSKCNVIAVDRDENVLEFANKIKQEYNDRFSFFNMKFSEIKTVIQENSLDGIVLDLGISSMQVDNGSRGFSFNKDAKLSMGMGRNTITADEVINNFEERNIADIIFNYGEEVKARAIAKKIVEYRKNKKIETTCELADIVRSCFSKRHTKIDYATKTFQAIRIFVNEELIELEKILNDSVKLLKQNGRLIVVSFHSLEDRIVKKFFNKYGDTKLGKVNKYKEIQEEKKSILTILTKKAILVSEEEQKNNKRSRSAKLRGAKKC